ncbi:unnamed protein product [Adineta ricciae]|uniref:Uncharacterized protein n=1 Tax=Adineta ricciae TaxID=249248 RepID=A0A815MRJ9_ADIRI|nr:unnamed protein product [Adineta ricciae]CAF1424231.1 unnamed protein product [Adineta ricciae]
METEMTTSNDTIFYTTTEFDISTTIEVENTSISTFPVSSTLIPSRSLSNGAIAGIVIGSIAGVVLLVLLVYFIIKYRSHLLDKLKTPPRSNGRSPRYKPETSPQDRILSPPGEYLSLATSTSTRSSPKPPPRRKN